MAGRVIMTRQPAQAGAVEAGLRAAGWTVQFLPLTDFELPADLTELRASVDRLRSGGYAWLVVTSPNTVRSLARAGWDGRVPATTRVAVTGPGTARVLAAAGGPATPWMPDGDASAAGIIAGFPAAPGGTGATATAGRVLLPQSALATEEVVEALRSQGWDVERVEAYRTVPYPAAPERRLLASGPATAEAPGIADGPMGDVVTLPETAGAVVVLTSPSAARELARQRGVPGIDGLPVGFSGARSAGGPAGTRFVAIGQPTRRAAEQAGIVLSGTAPSPDAPGLLAVLDGRPVPRPR